MSRWQQSSVTLGIWAYFLGVKAKTFKNVLNSHQVPLLIQAIFHDPHSPPGTRCHWLRAGSFSTLCELWGRCEIKPKGNYPKIQWCTTAIKNQQVFQNLMVSDFGMQFHASQSLTEQKYHSLHCTPKYWNSLFPQELCQQREAWSIKLKGRCDSRYRILSET